MYGTLGILVWLIIAGTLVFIEATTVQLVCIWFAVGSLFAALAAFVGAPFWLQLLVCLISSIAVLIVGRPLLLDKLQKNRQPTNADRLIGQYGVVKQEIDNLKQTGRVSASGLDWSARSEYGEIIPPETPVLILRIDGVKLIVQPYYQGQEQPGRPAPAGEEAPGQPEPSVMDQVLAPQTQPEEIYGVPDLPDAPDIELAPPPQSEPDHR